MTRFGQLRQRLLRFAARRYVAGDELEDALRAARVLAAHGFGAAIAYWDGADDPPAEVAAAYSNAADALRSSALDAYLSVKAPSVGYDAELLAGLRARLHLDSLGPETQERVLALGERLRAGVTLPARWRRSLADVERVAAAGLRVRVVKGQWPDPGGDVSSYLELVEALAGRVPLGVATHDQRHAREAFRLAPDAELELLYGLPRPRVDARSVRIYVPYGHAWLPYALSHVRRNPKVLWWTARDVVRRRQPNQ